MKKLDLKELKNLVAIQEPSVTAYLKFTGNRVVDYYHIDRVINGALTEAKWKFPDEKWTFESVEVSDLFAARSVTDPWRVAVFFKSATVEGFYPLREFDYEGVFVDHGFYVKPILSLLEFRLRYSLIWIEEERVRVYACDYEGMTLVREFLDQETLWEKSQHPEDRKSCFAPITKQARDVLNLKNSVDLELKHRALRFYRCADRAIRTEILPSKCPVVLVGDGRLNEIYLSANRRKTSFLKVMDSNEGLLSSMEAIYLKSMEAVAIYHRKPSMERALNYLSIKKMGLVIDSFVQVAGNAAREEVGSLIVRGGAQIRTQIDRMFHATGVEEQNPNESDASHGSSMSAVFST